MTLIDLCTSAALRCCDLVPLSFGQSVSASLQYREETLDQDAYPWATGFSGNSRPRHCDEQLITLVHPAELLRVVRRMLDLPQA